MEIFAIQPDRSGLRQLTDSAVSSFAPAPSPDGKQIAFVSSRDGTVKLYLMDIEGRYQRVLAGDTGQSSSPAWSPVGRWIVFLSDRTGSWAAHITAVDGSGSCLLASPELQATAPVWSPDEDWVYFVDRATNALMAIRPDSQDFHTVFQDDSITTLYSPAWSPGG